MTEVLPAPERPNSAVTPTSPVNKEMLMAKSPNFFLTLISSTCQPFSLEAARLARISEIMRAKNANTTEMTHNRMAPESPPGTCVIV